MNVKNQLEKMWSARNKIGKKVTNREDQETCKQWIKKKATIIQQKITMNKSVSLILKVPQAKDSHNNPKSKYNSMSTKDSSLGKTKNYS